MISGSIKSVSVTGSKELIAAARKLRERRKLNAEEFVRWRAAIVTKDLEKWTPPRGKSPSGESFNAQRQRGYESVKRDIKRVFRSGSDLWDILKLNPIVQSRPKLAAYLIELIGQMDYAKLYRILRALKSKIQMIPEPLQEQHFAQRSSITGRVKKGASQYYVLDDKKIDRYVARIKKDVGKLKHGWAAAVIKLGVRGIPNWIMSQPTTPGSCDDQTRHPTSPFVLITNDAKGIDRFDSLIADACEINQRKMLIEAGKMVDKTIAETGWKA